MAGPIYLLLISLLCLYPACQSYNTFDSPEDSEDALIAAHVFSPPHCAGDADGEDWVRRAFRAAAGRHWSPSKDGGEFISVLLIFLRAIVKWPTLPILRTLPTLSTLTILLALPACARSPRLF